MVSRKRYQRGASILCGFLSDGRTWNVEIFHALVERTRVEREIFQLVFRPFFRRKEKDRYSRRQTEEQNRRRSFLIG